MYYNTTNEKGEKLKEYKEKALSQEEKIMQNFNNQDKFYSDRELGIFTTTSSRLYKFLFLERCPITSVRRSITNLVKNGRLEYTGQKVLGLYGRNENVIKLKQ